MKHKLESKLPAKTVPETGIKTRIQTQTEIEGKTEVDFNRPGMRETASFLLNMFKHSSEQEIGRVLGRRFEAQFRASEITGGIFASFEAQIYVKKSEGFLGLAGKLMAEANLKTLFRSFPPHKDRHGSVLLPPYQAIRLFEATKDS